MENKKRLNWDEYAIKLAEVAALRSPDPYRKIGSVILDEENRVIAVGYNGLAKGKEVDDEFWADRDKRRPYMIHAEMNALSLIKRGEGKTLASTLLPCSCCANVIAAHGIKRVVFTEIYEKDTSAFEIFKFHGIELIQNSVDSSQKDGKVYPDFDEIQ